MTSESELSVANWRRQPLQMLNANTIKNLNIMNTIVKNAWRSGALALAGMLAFASCSDTWDEHYDAANSISYDGTTLAYIKSQPNLSDFSEVLSATGYDKVLESSQILTVFAPSNGSFNKDSLLAEIAKGRKQNVIDRFVKNHVARYNVSLNNTAQSVQLINEKFVSLGTLASPTVAHAVATQTNLVCENGVMQVLNGDIPYSPNLFEALEIQNERYFDAHPELNPDTVTLFNFLKRYDDDQLDVARSVARGYDENGNIVYVDSVMIRRNRILEQMDAFLYLEDSNYLALYPTVEAYQERVEKSREFFHFNISYNQNQAIRDSLQNYYANYYAMSDLMFNMNMNQHPEDSLFSTTYNRRRWEYGVFYKPFESDGIIANTTDMTECSNGLLYTTDAYPYDIYNSFYREIKIEGESMGNLETGESWTDMSNTSFATYSKSEADTISGHAFMYVSAPNPARQTLFAYSIPNTLSGKYDIYIRMLPQSVNVTDSATLAKSLPAQFRVSLYERDAKGVMPTTRATYTFRNPVDGNRNYHNDPYKIDSVYIGQYDFTDCYLNTTSGVLLQFESYVTSSQRNSYTKDMYIDYIVLVPVKEEANVSATKGIKTRR